MTDTLSIDLQSYGEHALTEQDMCLAVGQDLTKHYPGYDWAVGVSYDGGTVTIRLMVEDDPDVNGYGYLLHLATLMAPGAHQRVMQAGGEILERYGLPRDRAPERWRMLAIEHGVRLEGIVERSRH